VSFPAPGYGILSGIQEFRVLVRKNGTGGNPVCEVRLKEGGVLKATLTTASVSSVSGEVLSGTWDPALLSDLYGLEVECEVVSQVQQDASLEVGAIEWTAKI
jgi:hypothetical protein